MYDKLTPPSEGSKISFENGKPIVPDNPIIPFIRGDGTGVDIWPATEAVIDAAVKAAYGEKRKINWFKVYAGDEACEIYCGNCNAIACIARAIFRAIHRK